VEPVGVSCANVGGRKGRMRERRGKRVVRMTRAEGGMVGGCESERRNERRWDGEREVAKASAWGVGMIYTFYTCSPVLKYKNLQTDKVGKRRIK